MKFFIFILLTIMLTAESNKTDLLCHRWIAVGGRQPASPPQLSVSKYYPVRISFKKDGTCFREENFYGKIISNGTWKFSDDSTKICIKKTSNESFGRVQILDPLKAMTVIDTILELTGDTLKLGSFFYMPPDSALVHHDLYYVKEE
jgi:hypothetical protein